MSASFPGPGTLTYEAVAELTQEGLGQSTAVGIGGDPIKGFGILELMMFSEGPDTLAVVMIGEIGGTGEQEAAAWIRRRLGGREDQGSAGKRHIRRGDARCRR